MDLYLTTVRVLSVSVPESLFLGVFSTEELAKEAIKSYKDSIKKTKIELKETRIFPIQLDGDRKISITEDTFKEV